jgi:hypothetical protein
LEDSNYTAGRYEYVRVTSVTGAGGAGDVVSFFPPLTYDYTQASPDLTIGQRRYQVIRVPQYSTLSVSGSIRPLRWDGLIGGIVALDVAGAVTFSGAGPHINASGTGFRTSYGERGGTANGDRQFVNQSAALTGARDTPKAEGIAGTPRYMWIPANPLLTTSTGTFITNPDLNANTQGYPGGDYGRGAPGNAGGAVSATTPRVAEAAMAGAAAQAGPLGRAMARAMWAATAVARFRKLALSMPIALSWAAAARRAM